MTPSLNRSSEIEREQSFPVKSESTLEMASSICFGVTDFKDTDMAISPEKMKALLGRFAVVFPLPTQAHADDFISVWAGALKDFDESEITSACERVLISRRQFPAIADVVDEIRAAQATPNV
jgi:hypothetical protein